MEECGIQSSLCSVNLPSVKTWMEGTYDIPYKTLYFFVKSDGVFDEMQIIIVS